jgi:hypothetical protein
MADHERHRRLLLLGERQDLHCKFAQVVAIKRNEGYDPETIAD